MDETRGKCVMRCGKPSKENRLTCEDGCSEIEARRMVAISEAEMSEAESEYALRQIMGTVMVFSTDFKTVLRLFVECLIMLHAGSSVTLKEVVKLFDALPDANEEDQAASAAWMANVRAHADAMREELARRGIHYRDSKRGIPS